MTDIVERLRGSPHTNCLMPQCMSGAQVCDHSDEVIMDMMIDAMKEAAAEIERLRAGGCARNQRLTQYWGII